MREDFNGFCAYCGVHEDDWPHGQRNYHLDHFKPKEKFKDTIDVNDFYNLRWCCHPCNGALGKGDTWPSHEEEVQGIGFVDLCVDDWKNHYHIQSDGTLEALTIKAQYTIAVIGLNSDDYVKQRRAILARAGTIFESAKLPGESTSSP